ncbi:MAG TPA: Uma2 family endonuclease [Tepidisphaeraceae bacterium]|jgi:Uma2 family endonuclease
MALPKDGYKRELLNGEIVMSPAGSKHGRLIMRFASAFTVHVYQHQLGEVFDGQTGFRMKSRDVLIPDISFVSKSRLAGLHEVSEGFFEGSPDLAIEFRSPSDTPKRFQKKLVQYFENNTLLAWGMNSKHRTVSIYRGPDAVRILKEGDVLTGEDVVPGFTIPVAKVFEGF